MPKDISKYNDDERKELLNNLFNILGINEHNNTFMLYTIDNDIEIQTKILNLEPQIRKLFFCGSWNCFRTPNIKRKPLSIIKCLVKEMGYSIMSARRNVKINDEIVNGVVYHITKNNI